MANESESASAAPVTTDSKSPEPAEPPAKSKPEVEYDDFGLPVRRPQLRTPVDPDTDSDDDSDVFQDASSKAVTPVTPIHAANQIPKQEKGKEDTLQLVKEDKPRQEKAEATPEQENKDEPGVSKKEETPKLETENKVDTPVQSRKDQLGTVERKEATKRTVAFKEDTYKQEKEEPPETPKEEVSKPELEVKGDTPEEETKEQPENPKKAEETLKQDSAIKEGTPNQDKLNEEPSAQEKGKEAIKLDTNELPETPKSAGETKAHAESSTETPAKVKRKSQHVAISEYSHQQLAPETHQDEEKDIDDDGGWQTMPAYARYDMYDDDNKLIAKENEEMLEDMSGYGNVGGAAKGYTRVIMDDDADSQTSMDENTAYLFKEKGTTLFDEDEDARDPLLQMQATKDLLTETQRIAYVGLVRLAMVELLKKFDKFERNRHTRKIIDMNKETTKMWSQKMMVRLYTHMEINASEQVMIEQLSDHGVVPADLTPALMLNARVKNPVAEEVKDEEGDDEENDEKDEKDEQDKKADKEERDEKSPTSARPSVSSPRPESDIEKEKIPSPTSAVYDPWDAPSPPPPPYQEHHGDDFPEVHTPSHLPNTKSLDIDLRWTVLCDLFLVLIADSVYDARSRELFQEVGKSLSVDWIEICRFERRVTEALEMQEQADKENWNEDEHIETRRKRALNRRIAMMGLATVGGGLVIGLSAGLMAPLIGAGLVAGLTTFGMGGAATAATGFLTGAGGAAVIATTGVVSGSTVGVRAANRRTGSVKTFEYRPLHNNKRVNLIITLAGWMNGKVDDVRLPYSTVDPVMGDIYSVLWEPEMLRSMGDTINILATEALTQGLQQVLGSTVLIALMAAIQLPVALTKLAYLIDNPWTVSQARADMAGLILADSLIDRNLGTRPITLVGFSLGARVIMSCLKELSSRGAFGLVQNVYLFGTPVVAKKDEYIKVRAVVPGRFVNGYATNDWILGYLFRATSGGIMRVAGLAPVELPTIENVNVTEYVPGHMAYRAAMPKLLREVGWIVESDEFTEIEDPDPENHENRQRELINEIEEARKEIEKENEGKKKGFSWFRKKKTDKKDWEVYDENSQKKVDKDADPATISENPVIFDLDAIKAEVAALSAEGIEIKEIKSTLPPMKIDLASSPALRETKSYNDSIGTASIASGNASNPTINQANGTRTPSFSNGNRKQSYDEYNDRRESIEMSFDSSFNNVTPAKSGPSSQHPQQDTPSSWNSPANPSSSSAAAADRPPLRSSTTEPNPNVNLAPGYNAWTDEFDDDFGKEKEVKMSFM